MFQMSLQFSGNKDTLKDYLEKMTGKRISLFVTDNYSNLLSIRKKGNSASVRMHWMFLNAGDEVIREVADFIKKRQGRTLGSYCEQTESIRIHPVLDRENVPHYFIRYVVYHEMLHSILRREKNNGRGAIHSPEFSKRGGLDKKK